MKTQVITTPAEFKDWMSRCKSIFAFDCETTSLNYLDLEIVGFSIADGTQACYVDIKKMHKKDLLMILDYYLSEAKMVIMHNSPFDLMVLRKEGINI